MRKSGGIFYLRRTYKRLLFFFISLVVILLSGAVGYIVARQEPRIVEAEPSPTAVEAGANDARIENGASVTWIYDYEMCRHTDAVTSTADKTLVGLSFTQLQQKYPDCRIDLFEPDDIVLEKSLLCYCPRHYILKKNDEVLSVFRTKAGTEEYEKLRDFDISFDDIEKNEQESLTTGRVFSDMTDIEHYVFKLLQAG